MNPYVLREAEQELSVPGRKKKVMIIGAGPAGMRCAITASKRGHDVTLYEKKPYVGGMMYPGSRPEFKEDVARALDWFNTELKQSNVNIILNTTVTSEMVEKIAADYWRLRRVLRFETGSIRKQLDTAIDDYYNKMDYFGNKEHKTNKEINKEMASCRTNNDKHRVAEGYRVDPVVAWTDPMKASQEPFDMAKLDAATQAERCGYRCDYVAFMPLP